MSNSLEGLNVVHPPQSPSTESSGQELLSTPPGFPDLAAQLDLWTNLNFASDEPFIDTHRREEDITPIQFSDSALIVSHDSPQMKHDLTPSSDKTINLFASIESPSNNRPALMSNGTLPSFDLTSFLAGLGIDPFLVPPQPSPDSDFTSIPPSSIASRGDLSSVPVSNSSPDSDAPPASKRTRARKSSIISPPVVVTSSADSQTLPAASRAVSEVSDDHDPLSTPLTAAEDKRRRNTAASARFRAKKKEREQAMERRSKDLENRVNELERECEGLRRENGWLKGLVVGVTSGNPSGVPPPSTEEAKPHESTKKRKRELSSGVEE